MRGWGRVGETEKGGQRRTRGGTRKEKRFNMDDWMERWRGGKAAGEWERGGLMQGWRRDGRNEMES